MSFPGLPPLPAPLSRPTSYRKRSFDEYREASSDPALFSSDGPEPSVENYERAQRKRQHQRAWYEEPEYPYPQRPGVQGVARRKRKPFERNFDSGIYMGSDDSSNLEPDEGSKTVGSLATVNNEVGSRTSDHGNDAETEAMAELVSPEKTAQRPWTDTDIEIWHTEDPMTFEGLVFPYWQPQPDDLKRFHDNQFFASLKVGRSVETGWEILDLSNHDLHQMSSALLRPLRYYTKQNPSQNINNIQNYASLIPAIKLSLAKNHLEQVPGELYRLTNLVTLSLRNNDISEILPAMGNLASLLELNLGANRLRTLPYDLAAIVCNSGRAGPYTLHPNPFIKLDERYQDLKHIRKDGRMLGTRVAVTPTSFFDNLGKPLPQYAPPPSSTLHYDMKEEECGRFREPPIAEQHRTPTLTETVLRALLLEPTLCQLPLQFSQDLPHVSDLLKRAFRLQEAGSAHEEVSSDSIIRHSVDLRRPTSSSSSSSSTSASSPTSKVPFLSTFRRPRRSTSYAQTCTICGIGFVIPRTEWVEWLICVHEPVPFLRQGCSWMCWDKAQYQDRSGPFISGWTSPEK